MSSDGTMVGFDVCDGLFRCVGGSAGDDCCCVVACCAGVASAIRYFG
jgi:hypothetical protein